LAQASNSLEDDVRTLALSYPDLGAGQLYKEFQRVGIAAGSICVGFQKFKRVLNSIRSEFERHSSLSPAGCEVTKNEAESSVRRFNARTGEAETRTLPPGIGQHISELFAGKFDSADSLSQDLVEHVDGGGRRAFNLAEIHARPKPTEWAYNWDVANGGTAHPTARDGHSTLYVRVAIPDHPDRASDIDIASIGAVAPLILLGWEFQLEAHDKDDWNELLFPPTHLLDDTQPFSLKFRHERTNNCLRGVFILRQQHMMQKAFGDMAQAISKMPEDIRGQAKHLCERKHDFHGPLLKLESSSKAGFEALQMLSSAAPASCVAFLPHISEVLHLDGSISITATTGLGPESFNRGAGTRHRKGKRPSAPPSARTGEARACQQEVSTSFTMQDSEDVIARCLTSWNNMDFAELGPNIEMLAVREDRRGEGWLAKLFNIVEKFILSRWTMRGRTEDGKKRCRIFASYLTGAEIEQRVRQSGQKQSLSDKDFFFKYQGFDVRFDAQNHMLAGRPVDEDAVKYVKSVAGDSHLEESASGRGDEEAMEMIKNPGILLCHNCACAHEDAQLQLCNGCKQVRYCSAECQKKDWSRHKLWCKKSKEDVEDLLIEKGLLELRDDGSRVYR